MPEIVDDAHYRDVVNELLAGRVVPFLGAGANLCDRVDDAPWERGKNLPSGRELADHLAHEFGYPTDEVIDLLLVSQWGSLRKGPRGLYDKLHELFAAEYEPSRLHKLLAEIPAIQRERSPSPKYPLIVTTNYDDALERAFEERDEPEPYDLVWYEAKEEDEFCGSFFHRDATGKERAIENPAADMLVNREKNPVILKIHGAVNRANPLRDSYVITESNYIDYLSRTGIEKFPASIKQVMSNSYFLFLGYSLQDWNLRALLHRIWEDQGALQYSSWAIQWSKRPSRLDELFWNKRNVWIYNVQLGDYVAGLREAIAAAAPSGIAVA